MSKKKMIQELTDYLKEKLASTPVKKRRVEFRRESQSHEDTKQQKSRKDRRQSKKDLKEGNW